MSKILMAVERTVLTIKYQIFPNCQASSKKSQALCNRLSIAIKVK